MMLAASFQLITQNWKKKKRKEDMHTQREKGLWQNADAYEPRWWVIIVPCSQLFLFSEVFYDKKLEKT